MRTLWIKFSNHQLACQARTIARGFVGDTTFLPGQNDGFSCELKDNNNDCDTLDIEVPDDNLLAIEEALRSKPEVEAWGYFDLGTRHLPTPREVTAPWLLPASA
jgi:hypothetical protein